MTGLLLRSSLLTATTFELDEGSVAEGMKISIEPSWQTIQVIQDKYVQNQHLAQDISTTVSIETPTEEGLR